MFRDSAKELKQHVGVQSKYQMLFAAIGEQGCNAGLLSDGVVAEQAELYKKKYNPGKLAAERINEFCALALKAAIIREKTNAFLKIVMSLVNARIASLDKVLSILANRKAVPSTSFFLRQAQTVECFTILQNKELTPEQRLRVLKDYIDSQKIKVTKAVATRFFAMVIVQHELDPFLAVLAKNLKIAEDKGLLFPGHFVDADSQQYKQGKKLG